MNIFAALNKPDRRSLVLNILLAVGAALFMNGLIIGLGWDKSTDYASSPSFQSPGYVVGFVWECLFTLMATARWQLNAYSFNQASPARNWVTILMISCLLYPFYSLAINSQIGGLLGNLETIALTTFVIVQVWSISTLTALLILPVIFWVAFATATILKDLGWL